MVHSRGISPTFGPMEISQKRSELIQVNQILVRVLKLPGASPTECTEAPPSVAEFSESPVPHSSRRSPSSRDLHGDPPGCYLEGVPGAAGVDIGDRKEGEKYGPYLRPPIRCREYFMET